jgi:hypothetical protein
MTPLDIINGHRGRANAITAKKIVAQMGNVMPERALKDHIKHLIEDEGVMIAAGGTGYFIPTTHDELMEYKRYLNQKACSIHKREAAVVKAISQLPPEQCRFNLEARP